jgi:dihydrofolate reductase
MLYHIVAMAQNRIIGKDNKLPWHFGEDLRHFKRLTLASTVIMGRKTYESIGKPLPGRTNIVLSRTKTGREGSLRYVNSFERALEQVATPDAFIIGGAEIYKTTMSQIDGIYLTQIPSDYEGDARYPEIPADFVEKSRTRLKDDPLLESILYKRPK